MRLSCEEWVVTGDPDSDAPLVRASARADQGLPDHVMVSASCLGAQKRGLFRYQTGFRAMHSRLRMGQSTRGHYAI